MKKMLKYNKKKLRHEISRACIKPDPDRLRPLVEIPLPQTPKNFQCVPYMFAYNAKWINNISSKAGPLLKPKAFPLKGDNIDAFVLLK